MRYWALLLFAMLGAEQACFVPQLQFNCGRPEVAGEAIYWKPYGANVHYATIETEGDPLRHAKLLKPDYSFGYEAEVGYFFPCEVDRLGLRFTKIDWATNSRVGDRNIFDPLGAENNYTQATSNQHYLGLDLTWTRRFVRCNCFRIDLFGGIRYAGLDERILTFYNGNDVSQLMRLTKFRGLGPRIGVGTAWGFLEGFMFGGQLSVSAPTGRRRYRTDNGEIASKARESVIVPNVDLRAYARAAFDFCCMRIMFDLGYEMRCFSSLLYRPDLNQPVENQLDADAHLTLAGPFVGLTIRF